MVYSDLVLRLQHGGSTDTLHWPVNDQLHGQHVDPMCCSLMMTLILIVVATTTNNHSRDKSSKQWRWQ